MLKKMFSLIACATLAFAAVYADEETKTEGNDQGGSEQVLVNDESQDQGEPQDNSPSTDGQLIAGEDDSTESSEPKDSEPQLLLADEGDSTETSEPKDSEPQLLADEEKGEPTDAPGSEDQNLIAACGNGHCPAAMLEKLRQEQKDQQEQNS